MHPLLLSSVSIFPSLWHLYILKLFKYNTLEVGVVIFSSLLMKFERRMLGDGNRKGIWEKMTNAEKERERRYSEKYNHQVGLPLSWSLHSFLV